MLIFLGYEDFVDIFGGSSQNWTLLTGHFMHFRVLPKGQGTEWGILFWIGKISSIFGGA